MSAQLESSAVQVATSRQVSVVIPVFACKNCLEELVERVCRTLTDAARTYEIILIDDHSPDNAWERIEEISTTCPAVRGLRLSRNFGQHAAIAAGLKHATGEVVVVMDCDLQDIPEEIPRLLAPLEEGNEIALAQRSERQDSAFKRLGSYSFYRVLGWLTDTAYDHSTANFGAYSRKVVDALNSMPESERFLPLLIRWTGFKSVKIPVNHGRRNEGQSSYSFKKLFRMAARVALSFSDKPLRMMMAIAIAFAAIGAGVAAFSIYRYTVGDIRVAGFTSVIASIWLIGSAIMACIGITGLYIGRLYSEAKRRPLYLIWQDTQRERS